MKSAIHSSRLVRIGREQAHINPLLSAWHGWLSQPKYNRAWHESEIAEELDDYFKTMNPVDKLSEAADVVYTYTRAKWYGYTVCDFPLSREAYVCGLLYMFPKYLSRYLFYKRAGAKVGVHGELRCVRDPRKKRKLYAIAQEADIDPDDFIKICEKQLRYWPLLP